MARVAIATDNFNRADGDIGANWTASGAGGNAANKPDVSSNQLVVGAAEDEMTYYSAATFDTDQYAQATIINPTTSGWAGPAVRVNGDDSIWMEKNTSNTAIDLYWYNGGAYTNMGSYGSAGYSNNDVLRIEAEGTQIRVYQNDNLRITGNNIDIPIYNYNLNVGTLYPGIKTSNNTTDKWDDWEGGNLYATNRVRAHKEGSTVAGSNVNNDTFSIDSQDNSVLVVVVGARDTATGDLPVTGITFDGQALTKLRADLYNTSTYVQSEIWYLKNPPTGTGLTMALTFTGTCDFTRPNFYHLMDVDQTTPFEANAGTDGFTGSATSFSQDITTLTDGAILIDATWTKDNTDPTPGTGMIMYSGTSPNAGDDRFRTSVRRTTTAGTYAIAYSWTNSDGYACSIGALKPAGATTTHVGSMLTMFQ